MGKLDERKYQRAILYFVAACNNEHLGKTKLMKLLYYLDFQCYPYCVVPSSCLPTKR